MTEKINIAEILKDCPSGMELYSPLFGNCTFVKVCDSGLIVVKLENGTPRTFLSDGRYYDYPDAECLLFPSKYKTTWEGFQCPFKDGDIVVCTNKICTFTAIFKSMRDGSSFYRYGVMFDNEFRCLVNDWSDFNDSCRLATEEEKKELFDAIKKHCYNWNPETKTLEKLPKFKVGDKVAKKCNMSNPASIIRVGSQYYYLYNTEHDVEVLPIAEQDDWELVPDKFDINNLKPLQPVLVRDTNGQVWTMDLFSHKIDTNKRLRISFVCVGHYPNQCIPYEGNEHLLGTTNDCDEFYKNW